MSLQKSLNQILLTLSLLALIACSGEEGQLSRTEQKDNKEKKQEFAIPVEVTFSKVGDVAKYYQTTAVLEAEQESKVVNEVTGMLESIHAQEGQKVKAGDLLAQIDPQSYELDYERAKIDYMSANSEYQRSQPIDGEQLISEKDLDKLRFRVQTTENQLALAQIKLRNTKVVSPIDGVVAQRSVKAHNMLSNVGNDMFHIVSLNSLIGIVYLPESELNQVKVGQIAKLSFPAEPSLSLEAKVLRIAPLVDSQLGTFKVTLTIDNQSGTLKPGMFARVALLLDSKQAVTMIPESAVIKKDGNATVFTANDNRAKKLDVKLGYSQDGWIEVITPLASDDGVITVGQHGLKDNALINVLNKDKSAALSHSDDNSQQL
ncbi:efflux RND transporter periplasmic adaptor subunit [Thalassotalea sp. 1_MG-2023]|uniref:efflux RND transporter periplasmic adaptor subunit n=1 Tax=Thalassotalea sp. 1_MG-2023 TaxID=3062680 RepID=UPI0026E3656C|nr:efflux RND transporter periplasmic adaptor subunit [Thalassotalea sp. 1_MG-2023]MDO6427531.1 efflux RND transporter periplasmic adaptor subunit [Thalassotalea sp. 1_MG-2023]